MIMNKKNDYYYVVCSWENVIKIAMLFLNCILYYHMLNLQRLIGLYSKIFDDLGHLSKLRWPTAIVVVR